VKPRHRAGGSVVEEASVKRWGAIILCAAVATAYLGAAEQLALDGNNDGTADQWYQTTGGRVVEISTDRNNDGKVDYVARYGKGDAPEYEEYDFDYDGTMDDFYYYVGGVLVREEIDTNADGKVDLWVYLHKGIYIERYERDTDFDGKKDRVVDYGKR
jgi:hypothetical protein